MFVSMTSTIVAALAVEWLLTIGTVFLNLCPWYYNSGGDHSVTARSVVALHCAGFPALQHHRRSFFGTMPKMRSNPGHPTVCNDVAVKSSF